MRTSALGLGLVLAFLVFACSKNNQSKNDQPSQTVAVAPDNSGRNVRDRNDATKTAGDQSESEADRTISQNIRQAIVADARVGREICSCRGRDRSEKHIRVDVENTVGDAGRLVERAKPAVDGHEELRRTHSAHRVRRKSARVGKRPTVRRR